MNLLDDSRLTVRQAKPQEIANILEIFTLVTDWMVAKGINQWNYTYPNSKVVSDDIEAKSNWVALWDDKQIVGTITLNQDFDEQYATVKWDDSTQLSDIWSIHRLAVHPKHFGKGIGKGLCQYAEEYIAAQGGKAIRLDAYSENQISNKLYANLGYSLKEGKLYFHNNEIPFNAYEKLLLR